MSAGAKSSVSSATRRFMSTDLPSRTSVTAMVLAPGPADAGGIGMVLWDVIRGFEYAQTAAVLLMLVVTVSLIDLISSTLRKRVT